ncbi:DUF2953 domain-containing protein [Methanobrevibacter sp. OttesenSCG-928-K11]|nr:DUF2953 domain-containing protein [Methanobrevibacter sp. OttesenSCG-928-K11]MDL2270236.1 DUF2953 domain-containing protein [Methanobrevibacter sp. OttesenSCG-928-I08]
MVLLNIILSIILIIIIILFLILFFGIRISLNINKTQAKLVGFIHIKIFNTITIFKKEFPSKEESKPEKKDKDKSEDTSSSITEQWENIKPFISDIKKQIPNFIDFLKNTLKSIEISKFNVHLDLGFENYAQTAKIVGYIWSIVVIPNTSIKAVQITAKPIFIEPTLDFNANIDITIKLLKTVKAFLKLLFNKDLIRLIIKIIKSQRAKNE